MLLFKILILFLFTKICFCGHSYYDVDTFNKTEYFSKIEYPQPEILENEGDYAHSYFPMVDNLRMHFRCYINENTPVNKGEVVLFDSGSPFYSTAYGNVLDLLLKEDTLQVMGIHTACFFDRYGYGWSSASPKPIGIEKFVSMLKLSIDQIPILKNKKFYYIGWSYGGLNAQMFTMKYKDLVKGLLLIDSTDVGIINDPQWNSTSTNAKLAQIDYVKSLSNENFINMCYYSNQFTIEQGWISNDIPLIESCIKNSQKIMTNKNQNVLNALQQEISLYVANAKVLNNTFHQESCHNTDSNNYPFNDIPLVVLSALIESSNSTTNNITANSFEQLTRQSNIAKLSRNSYHITVDSNHFIPIYKPQYVVIELFNLILRSKKSKLINNNNNNYYF